MTKVAQKLTQWFNLNPRFHFVFVHNARDRCSFFTAEFKKESCKQDSKTREPCPLPTDLHVNPTINRPQQDQVRPKTDYLFSIVFSSLTS